MVAVWMSAAVPRYASKGLSAESSDIFLKPCMKASSD